MPVPFALSSGSQHVISGEGFVVALFSSPLIVFMFIILSVLKVLVNMIITTAKWKIKLPFILYEQDGSWRHGRAPSREWGIIEESPPKNSK